MNGLNNAQLIIPERQILSPRSAARAGYANDFSVLNPTLWANEAILRLLPQLVIGNLINRSFSNAPAKFGDIVNAFVPGDFSFARKGAPCENVTIQDATGAAIQVSMDQWPQVAFMICDGDEDRNFLDLIDTLLVPAINALSEGIDRIIANQVHQFYGHAAAGNDNTAGQLNTINNTNFLDYLTDAREVMNSNNVPLAGRAMVLSGRTETAALKNQNLINASFRGDDGTALRDASLGRLMGWDLFTGQTQPSIKAGQTVETALVNNSGGYPAGTTVLAYDADSPTDPFAIGEWVWVDGDGTPQHVVDVDSGTNEITIHPGLIRAAADDAVIRTVKSGAVNNVAGYLGDVTSPRRVGYAKQILVDGFTGFAPKIGQLVTFGNVAAGAGFEDQYGIIRVDTISAGAGTYGIWLDKPIKEDLANDETVNLGPYGEYNWGLLPNAIALVNRPPPKPRTGVLASVVNKNGIALRVTISYDAEKQGHLVVIDTFMGVGTVDPNVSVVMFG